MNNQGLFDILSNSGATDIFDLHPDRRVIAYSSGCYIVLWDLEADKKLMIHPHDYSVSFVKFFGPDNEYVVSLDCNVKPSIYITEWETMTRIQQVYLPIAKKNRSILNYKLGTSKSHSYLVLAENYNDQYQYSIWDTRADSLTLIVSSEDDNQTNCMKIEVFDVATSVFFAAIEKRCIKFWQYKRDKLELVSRTHVKEDIIDSEVSQLSQFCLFITKSGRLYVINSEGQYVSSLVHPDVNYSCLRLYNEYILLGSFKGEIEVYNLSSMKYVKSLKNIKEIIQQTRYAHLPKKSMESYTKFLDEDLSPSEFYQLKKLAIAKSTDLMVIQYSDNNLFLYDFQKAKIIASLTGHSDKIKRIVWGPTSRQAFVSCCNDATIRVWKFSGDRWESYPVLPPSILSQNKSEAKDIILKKESELGIKTYVEKRYKITSLEVDWMTNDIYAGDNKGALVIYDLITGIAKSYFQIGASRISEISLGTHLFGLAFENGFCSVFEKNGDVQNFIAIENSKFEIIPQAKYKKGIKLLGDDNIVIKQQEKMSRNNSFVVQSRFDQNSFEKGYPEMGSAKGIKQRVVTIHDVNTMRLYQVYKSQGSLSSLIISSYHVNGKIVDYELHPSNDYLMILSTDGFLNMFKLGNAELRGRIQIPEFSTSISVDPSGLYVVVASAYMNKYENNAKTDFQSLSNMLERDGGASSRSRKKETGEKKMNPDQSLISLFEIGTGEFVGEIYKVETVTTMKFSTDTSYLAVGSKKGLLTVLSIDTNLKENAWEVLEGMSKNPYFWSDFQLNIGEKKLTFREPLREDEPLRISGVYEDPADQDEIQAEKLEKVSKYSSSKPDTVNRGFVEDTGQTYGTNGRQNTSKDSYVRPPQNIGNQSAHIQEIKTDSKIGLSTSWNHKIERNVKNDDSVSIKSYLNKKQNSEKKSNQATLLITNNRQNVKNSGLLSINNNNSISSQAHADKSKNLAEKIRQNNLEEMHPKKISLNTYKAIVEDPTPLNKAPKIMENSITISDKVIDKYLDVSTVMATSKRIRNTDIPVRDLRPDPDDIDDGDDEEDYPEPDFSLQFEKPNYHGELKPNKFGNLDRAPFLKSDFENGSTSQNEASLMYQDLSDFERKFLRIDGSGSYY